MKKEPTDGYTKAEIDERALDMIRRGFQTPHKPLREMVGTTDRAKAMRRTKLKHAVEKAKQAT